MNEKTVNIDNFIGVYDNYITKEECNKIIKFYEEQNKFNKTFNRISTENQSVLQKQDQQYFANSANMEVWWNQFYPTIMNKQIVTGKQIGFLCLFY